jgi:cell division septation protein DedD
VGLIAAGASGEESAFLDASAVGGRGGEGGEGGGDVFFLTLSQLAPQDEDQAFDVYDAHECNTGSPCPPPQGAVQPACNNAESCRAAGGGGASNQSPEIFGAPPSATFNGQGNVTSEAVTPPPAVVKPKTKTITCKKPKKLTHGKCVRAKAKKKGKKANRR